MAAIVLSLTRMERAGMAEGLRIVAFIMLPLLVFLINSFCVAIASLGNGRVAFPVFLVCVLAVFLAAALAVATQWDKSGWWAFVGFVLAMSAPSVIAIASLLVVRSCGYRLIRKRRPMAEDVRNQSSLA
jgi:thiol:disulfide interchange protein